MSIQASIMKALEFSSLYSISVHASSIVEEPSKETLDLPPTLVALELSAILRLFLLSVATMWGNDLNTLRL
jgi:hypothetical protein